ncbi:beta-ketoacyl synthase domain-containing protein [Colletotrichum truncatum]|uniref:Beta-ketoacyl synthase domain-containing protein n=1 Tax=Colletotrichum truncatum TaxID=5467 RepID=A0ACC3YDV0_COLTU|nr:beta-ketoacyl synthase domain-containing protein [Colletotrichum truncatum]KAF6791081.1 beta-ketoacyl synthase domain-containing protein [Colletotrichum truncatum]
MDTDNSEWASEPIAVIGMSCKFSGGASNPDKLWDLMSSGKTGWSEIPDDRFNLNGVYHSNHERNSTTHVKGGHFLDNDVAAFDAAFFNYSAEMAQAVDPQFRLQLESTYEALENAGLPLSQVMGSQTSVFAGVFTHDYQEGIIRDEDRLPRFNVVGTWSPMSSNRISHFFDFRGASMTLETGCSTTLVALHQAVNTLRNREADMSVVTGANVMLNPDTFKAIGSLGMLSPDGRSYAFDSRANGYGRGEGVATIIIKRLSDALAANDPIRAVIRETALNQDGKTDTITTPSGSAQVELMRECYRRAGLDPRGTQYFEAHGTGTPTGDPIEAGAMAAIFGIGEGRDNKEHYLRIGSVKTNVGHTEAASGLAAIVKGVLCFEKGLIPPTVNYEIPNPKLKLDEWHLKVVREVEQWPDSLVDGPRRMSINNFGYGGANAHVILESADPWTLPLDLDLNPVNGNGNGTHIVNGNGHPNGKGYENGSYHTNDTQEDAKVLILSARDERGCQQMVSDLKAYLENHKSLGYKASEQLLRNLSYTLNERRTLFQWVAAHQVRLEKDGTLDTAIQALDSPRFKPSRRASDSPRIGFVFTGQGAQWYGMGRELLTSYPIFRRSIEEAEAYLQALGADWSLIEELHRDAKTTKVHATNISIPLCVAVQIALVSLLESWGITASGVVSHSSGEIAAAFAVGALTHRQAMATAYYRAMLVADETNRAPGAAKGAMAAVGLGVDAVQSYIDRLTKGKAGVACVNSPKSVTISGDADAVQEIEDLCKQDDVFARRLKVQQAYHSHHMDPFADAYRERLRIEMARDVLQTGKQHLNTATQELKAVFSSAVTGGRITNIKEIASPDHWVGSLVQPVEFVEAFTEMVLGDPDDPTGRSVDALLEVGPHTALGGPIREILSLPEFEGIDLPYWGCLVRDEHAGDSMRSAAINLFRQGQSLVMDQINFPVPAYDDEGPQVLTDLPSYPWNHSMRHWQESRINKAIRERSQPPHELLGMPVAGNDPSAAVWRRILRVNETPWVRDHMVQGSIVYPGSGYICLAIEAARQLEKIAAAEGDDSSSIISGFRLRDVNFLFALVIPDNADGVEIRTTLQAVPEREIGVRGWRRFEVSSVRLDNRWTLHAKGMIMVERKTTASETTERRPLSTYTRHPDPQDLFANLRARSVYHGPLFQNTAKIVQDGREPRSVCDITVRHEASTDTDPVVAAQNTLLHPITLDAVVVAFYSALPSVGALQDDPKLPRSVASMWVSSDISREIGHTLRCDTSLLHEDAQSGVADITVFDGETDATVLKIKGVELASLGRGSGATARQDAANKGGNAFISKWEQEVCSKLVWGPDLSLRNPLALEQIKKQLVRKGSDVEAGTVRDLNRLCVYFARDMLEKLTSEDVTQLQEQPHLAKYYTWLHELTAKADKVWVLDESEKRQQFITATATQSVDAELICRLGPLLPSILRGELNVEEVAELIHDYNAKAMRRSSALGQLSKLLQKVAHKTPGARVLQIGNNTGANVTRFLLESLGTPKTSLVESWHITEPSSESFEVARGKLSEWTNLVEFDQLDLDQSLSKQKFTPGSYDIVVSFQGLRGIKNTTSAVANVRNLLKPSGTFLFAETTKDQADVDFIFGLLPGWWQSQDGSDHTTITTSSWDNILRDAGFSGVDLEVPDSESDMMHTNSIIMSTVPITEEQKLKLDKASDQDRFVVVSSNKTPLPLGFVDLLSQRIQALTGHDSVAPDHLILEKSSLDKYKNKICVFVGEIDKPILEDLGTVLMEGVRAMVTQCKGLLWVTTGSTVESEAPERALSHGFLRVLRNEYIGRHFLSLDLDPVHAKDGWSSGADVAISTIEQVLGKGFDHAKNEAFPSEFEYAERDGVLHVPRYYKDDKYNDMVTGPLVPSWTEMLPVAKDEKGSANPSTNLPLEPLFQADQFLRLEVGIPGHLDTLAFVHDEKHDESLAPQFVEITPRAYGVCSRDVMSATGQIKDRSMGLECAGIIRRVGTEAQQKGYNVGDRVMALTTGASFANYVLVPWHGVIQVPNGMDFTAAASIPLAFTIAYAALIDTACLTAGQSVLIHAAAGAIGQAAIMLAKRLGVTEIYATVGSQEKRELLQREYGIPTERIFSSRNASFGAAILAATHGRGVDLVLNSLPGPLLQASLSVVAPLGYLVEIGKKDIESNSLVALESFSRGISFITLDVPTLLRRRGPEVHRALDEIVRLLEQQAVKPVQPVTVFPMQDAQAAFRFVQTGAHLGKVVLSARTDELAHVVPQPRGVTARTRLRPDSSYLIVGGVGGIGRSVAHWLVAHGAKNLILLSRSAGDLDHDKNNNTDGALFIRELREAGCRVKPVSCDIAIPSSLTMALRACEDDGLPPVRGVIQGAMLLRDAIFEQMTLDDWHSGLRPKLYGTWNLHTEFSQPGSLDFFVMLSSVSGVVGIASQTNYAAGGSYEDAMARWRQSRGLPGVAIDLGPISDIGYVSTSAKVAERLRKDGDFAMLDEDMVLRALNAAVLHPLGARSQIIVGLNSAPGPQWDANGRSQLGRDARFSPLRPRTKASARPTDGESTGTSLATQLAEASDQEQGAELIGAAIATKLADIFMTPVAEIDLSKPPAHFGVDSLIAVELRNMLVLQAAADISIFNILQTSSLAALAKLVAEKSQHFQEA